MVKKKVSFDIDQKLLADIKTLCMNNDMKLADFFRTASLEKLKNDNTYYSIYIPINGKIEHFHIGKDMYEIDIFEADQLMKINVGAKCEGIARLFTDRGIKYKENDKLYQLIKENGKIAFYTTKKYC